MKVYYSCSVIDILDHKKFYRAAVDIVKKAGHTHTREWIEDIINRAEPGKPTDIKKGSYQSSHDAMVAADVCIYDISVADTSLGSRIATSLLSKKPVLIIANKKLVDMKNVFIAENQSPLLYKQNYTDEKNLESIITKFLTEHTIKPKNRFNLLLDKKYLDYLNWASLKYNMNKTDIIKRALDTEMNHEDDYTQ